MTMKSIPALDAVREKVDRQIAAEDSWPERFAMTGVYDEIEINHELAGLPGNSDAFEVIRRHKNALHALTPNAFRAVIPYYLKFGLEGGGSGIMDHVVFFFTSNEERAGSLRERLAHLTSDQVSTLIEAIEVFRDTYWNDVSEFKAQADRAVMDIRAISS